MSKIKIDVPFEGFEGPIQGEDNGVSMTLKSMVVKASIIGNPNEVDGEAKYKVYKVGQKFVEAEEEVELSAEEIVLIKKLIANVYPSPMVIGIAYDMLEGK